MERERRAKERFQEKERKNLEQVQKRLEREKEEIQGESTSTKYSVSPTLSLDSLFLQIDIEEDNGQCSNCGTKAMSKVMTGSGFVVTNAISGTVSCATI